MSTAYVPGLVLWHAGGYTVTDVDLPPDSIIVEVKYQELQILVNCSI